MSAKTRTWTPSPGWLEAGYGQRTLEVARANAAAVLRGDVADAHRHPGAIAAHGALRTHLGSPGGMSLLVGPRGIGKTVLACMEGIRIDAARPGASQLYTRADDLWARQKATFDQQRRDFSPWTKDPLDCARHAAFLVLDEVQLGAQTPWEAGELVRLIDHRYQAMKATVMIANLAPEDVRQRIDASIVSRVNECGGVILCKWPSYRDGGTR